MRDGLWKQRKVEGNDTFNKKRVGFKGKEKVEWHASIRDGQNN